MAILQVKLHRDVSSLTEVVSQDILPISLGGTLSEEDAFDDELVPRMLEMEGYYRGEFVIIMGNEVLISK